MGLAYGFAETFNSLAIVLAPLLAGVLYTRDPLMVYWVSLGLIGTAILVSTIATPRDKSPLQTAVPVDIHPPPLE
jgi:MFS family permease